MTERSDADDAAPRERMRPVDPRLLRYARASRVFFAAIALIAAAQAAVIVAFAWLATRAVTGVIDGMPFADVAATLGMLGGVVAVRALLLWARETVASRAAARVQTELRGRLVDAVGELGPEWLGARSTAGLAVTAGRGLDALEAYFGRYLPQLVQTVVVTPLILLVMWWEDWISGLTVLLTLPLIPIFMVLIGLVTRAIQQKQWKTLQHLAARFSDTVQGLSTLKVYGRQHRAAASIAAVTERYRAETMKVLRVSFLSGLALEFFASISVAIVAVSIGFRLVDGSLTLAVGLFVLLLAPEAYLPLRQVGVQFHAAAEGVAATDDVFEVLDAARASSGATAAAGAARTAAPDAERARRDGGRAPGLVLADVRVRRGGRALDPVGLTAAPGTVTLVEGPSGAGKTSLIAALRGAAPFDGDAHWNGQDVRALAPSEWLAWAGQQPGLVSGTVAANVALGDDAPDPGLVERALELACADGIRPDLALGVQGTGLSGGQGQRVAVARAVYRHLRGRAGLIALDEPSAALDAHTEARLWRSVRELADGGAAVLLVSHRESARDFADVVVRMGVGEVFA
ncbi:thiol reductant ABC exporter subunit CydD [Microbacter sp. GSS18]|nr:thiol reductant ABC exporter subunit CydD [Microbacter sp. GSS18]